MVKIKDQHIETIFQKTLKNLTDLDNTLAALDADVPNDIEGAFSKYRKANKEHREYIKVLMKTYRDLFNKYRV